MSARIPIDKLAIADFCRKWHVTALALFGSVLRMTSARTVMWTCWWPSRGDAPLVGLHHHGGRAECLVRTQGGFVDAQVHQPVHRWIKKVGDAVDRDEPLFEISTDKVDAEIPSPAAGVLTEIMVKEGETVAGQQRRRRDRRRPASRPRRLQPAGAGAAPAADGGGAPELPSAQAAPPPQSAARRRRCRRRGSAGAAAAPGGGRRARSCGGRNRRRWSGASRASTTSTSRASRAPASAAASPSTTSSASSSRGRPPRQRRRPTRRAPGRSTRRRSSPARRVADRADDGHAPEDRRAHGAQRAHVAARVLGLRGELRAASRSCARRRRRSTSAPAPS